MKSLHSTFLSIFLALASALGATAQDSSAGTIQGTKTNELMVLAAARGSRDEVKRLLNVGVNVNARDERGLTAWQAAKIYGRKGVADFLAGQGADTSRMSDLEKTLPDPSRKSLKEFLSNARQFMQQETEHFRKEIPNGRVVEFTNTDHHCFIQREDEVVREMREFLAP